MDQTTKILILEGLDGCGKTALANELKQSIEHKSIIIDSVDNKYITEYIRENAQNCSLFILDRSWLSGEATRYASNHGGSANLIQEWPSDIYKPTHLFLLTLPEEKRLMFMGQKQNQEFTNEEIRLRDDDKYRNDYLYALTHTVTKMKSICVCRILDDLSITDMAKNIRTLIQ